MAGPYFVRSSDGSDASDGLTWANAKATLTGGLAVAAAGETIYVSDNHAESTAGAISLTSAGTAISPVLIFCVDDAGDPEPPTALATTGVVTTTGSSAISFAGFAYCFGLSFNSGSGSSGSGADINFTNTGPWGWMLDECVLEIKSTGSGAELNIGSTSSSFDGNSLTLLETDVRFNSTGQSIRTGSRIRWLGGALSGNQTDIFNTLAQAVVTIEGVDLSASSGNLIQISSAKVDKFTFLGCKRNASANSVNGPLLDWGDEIEFISCDDNGETWRTESFRYGGSTVADDATFVTTGGASDGVTPISWKMVSLTGKTSFQNPLISPWMTGFINTTGSKTFTVEILHDSVTNLQDDEIWLEVEFLGTSSSTQLSFADDRAADVFATPVDQATSTTVWTEALTNDNEQKLSVTATVNVKGPFRARVHFAKDNSTVFIDPKVTIS